MTAIPSEVRNELDKLEKRHAENPEGRYFVPLANAYRKSGDVARAVELLRKGLSRHPEYVSAHIVLARCLADLGDLGAAKAEFHYVLQLDGQNLVALRTLGEYASNAGDVDEARKWFGQLLAVDPMNEEARRALDLMSPSATPKVDGPAVTPGTAPRGSPESSATKGPDDGLDLDFAGIDDFGFETDEVPMVDLDEVFGDRPQRGDAVVTETIAELYTRQGFYDRAAEVYRELIRRRGSSDHLEAQLRHVGDLAASHQEGVGDASDGFEVAIADTIGAGVSAAVQGGPDHDAFAESFADGFPADEDDWGAVDAITLPGDDGGAVSTPAGEPATIRDQLRALLGAPSGDRRAVEAAPTRGGDERGEQARGDGGPATRPAEGLDAYIGEEPEFAVTPPEPPFTSLPDQEAGVFVEDRVWDDSGSVMAPEESPFEPPRWGEPPSSSPAEAVSTWPVELPDLDEGDERSALPDVGDTAADEARDALRVDDGDAVGHGDVLPAAPRDGNTDPGEHAAAAQTEDRTAAERRSGTVGPPPGVEDDELFPWEIPLEDEAPASPLSSADDIGTEPPATFDDVTSSPEHTTHEPERPAEPPNSLEPPGPPEQPAAEAAEKRPNADPAPVAEPAEDEDDLESFQAWLRSLKR
jgi:tetratricopeptide (TPR) repeat protein